MSRSARGRALVAAGALAVVTLAAYAESFRGAFVFDDEGTLLRGAALHAVARGEASALRLFDHRPVGRLSLALNYRVSGERVAGYHAVNLAVHVAAGLFLFGLVRRTGLLIRPVPLGEPAATGLGFAAALLWLLHPLQTQAVTYVVQRYESMAGMFTLACLYCVVRSARGARPRVWQLGAVAAGWLAVGTKEVAIAAPAVALLVDRALLAHSWRGLARERGGMYAALAPALLWLGASSAGVLGRRWTGVVGFGIPGVSWTDYLASQPGVILHYLRLALWPHPLCFDYGWPVARAPLDILVPGALVTGLLVGSALCLGARPWLGVLGLSFFLLLAPSSSVLPLADLAVEHRMYLPLASVATLAVAAAGSALGRLIPADRPRRVLSVAALATAGLALGARTFDRNRDYHDPVALWRSAADAAPDNPRAHYNLGVELERRGRVPRAIRRYRRALELEPRYADAHTNLGILLAGRGRAEAALPHLRLAAALKPGVAPVFNNLASALMNLGRHAEARLLLARAVRLDPDYAEARTNLALVLAHGGDDARARVHLEAALRLDPADARLHAALAALHARQGRTGLARQHLEAARRAAR